MAKKGIWITSILIGMVTTFPFVYGRSGESQPDNRLNEIREELKTKREAREDALANAGVVCVAEFRPEQWYERDHDLEFDDSQVAVVAQLYATLTKKEVMVSSRVAKSRIHIRARGLSTDQAIRIIQDAFTAQRIASYALDDITVALCPARVSEGDI